MNRVIRHTFKPLHIETEVVDMPRKTGRKVKAESITSSNKLKKEYHLPIRQIERLTGINRGVIARS
jgi:hypothetical protein